MKTFKIKFTVPLELTVSGTIQANSVDDLVMYLRTLELQSSNDIGELSVNVYNTSYEEWLISKLCHIEEVFVPSPELTYIDDLKEIENEEVQN